MPFDLENDTPTHRYHEDDYGVEQDNTLLDNQKKALDELAQNTLDYQKGMLDVGDEKVPNAYYDLAGNFLAQQVHENLNTFNIKDEKLQKQYNNILEPQIDSRLRGGYLKYSNVVQPEDNLVQHGNIFARNPNVLAAYALWGVLEDYENLGSVKMIPPDKGLQGYTALKRYELALDNASQSRSANVPTEEELAKIDNSLYKNVEEEEKILKKLGIFIPEDDNALEKMLDSYKPETIKKYEAGERAEHDAPAELEYKDKVLFSLLEKEILRKRKEAGKELTADEKAYFLSSEDSRKKIIDIVLDILEGAGRYKLAPALLSVFENKVLREYGYIAPEMQLSAVVQKLLEGGNIKNSKIDKLYRLFLQNAANYKDIGLDKEEEKKYHFIPGISGEKIDHNVKESYLDAYAHAETGKISAHVSNYIRMLLTKALEDLHNRAPASIKKEYAERHAKLKEAELKKQEEFAKAAAMFAPGKEKAESWHAFVGYVRGKLVDFVNAVENSHNFQSYKQWLGNRKPSERLYQEYRDTTKTLLHLDHNPLEEIAEFAWKKNIPLNSFQDILLKELKLYMDLSPHHHNSSYMVLEMARDLTNQAYSKVQESKRHDDLLEGKYKNAAKKWLSESADWDKFLDYKNPQLSANRIADQIKHETGQVIPVETIQEILESEFIAPHFKLEDEQEESIDEIKPIEEDESTIEEDESTIEEDESTIEEDKPIVEEEGQVERIEQEEQLPADTEKIMAIFDAYVRRDNDKYVLDTGQIIAEAMQEPEKPLQAFAPNPFYTYVSTRREYGISSVMPSPNPIYASAFKGQKFNDVVEKLKTLAIPQLAMVNWDIEQLIRNEKVVALLKQEWMSVGDSFYLRDTLDDIVSYRGMRDDMEIALNSVTAAKTQAEKIAAIQKLGIMANPDKYDDSWVKYLAYNPSSLSSVGWLKFFNGAQDELEKAKEIKKQQKYALENIIPDTKIAKDPLDTFESLIASSGLSFIMYEQSQHQYTGAVGDLGEFLVRSYVGHTVGQGTLGLLSLLRDIGQGIGGKIGYGLYWVGSLTYSNAGNLAVFAGATAMTAGIVNEARKFWDRYMERENAEYYIQMNLLEKRLGLGDDAKDLNEMFGENRKQIAAEKLLQERLTIEILKLSPIIKGLEGGERNVLQDMRNAVLGYFDLLKFAKQAVPEMQVMDNILLQMAGDYAEKTGRPRESILDDPNFVIEHINDRFIMSIAQTLKQLHDLIETNKNLHVSQNQDLINEIGRLTNKLVELREKLTNTNTQIDFTRDRIKEEKAKLASSEKEQEEAEAAYNKIRAELRQIMDLIHEVSPHEKAASQGRESIETIIRQFAKIEDLTAQRDKILDKENILRKSKLLWNTNKLGSEHKKALARCWGLAYSLKQKGIRMSPFILNEFPRLLYNGEISGDGAIEIIQYIADVHSTGKSDIKLPAASIPIASSLVKSAFVPLIYKRDVFPPYQEYMRPVLEKMEGPPDEPQNVDDRQWYLRNRQWFSNLALYQTTNAAFPPDKKLDNVIHALSSLLKMRKHEIKAQEEGIKQQFQHYAEGYGGLIVPRDGRPETIENFLGIIKDHYFVKEVTDRVKQKYRSNIKLEDILRIFGEALKGVITNKERKSLNVGFVPSADPRELGSLLFLNEGDEKPYSSYLKERVSLDVSQLFDALSFIEENHSFTFTQFQKMVHDLKYKAAFSLPGFISDEIKTLISVLEGGTEDNYKQKIKTALLVKNGLKTRAPKIKEKIYDEAVGQQINALLESRKEMRDEINDIGGIDIVGLNHLFKKAEFVSRPLLQILASHLSARINMYLSEVSLKSATDAKKLPKIKFINTEDLYDISVKALEGDPEILAKYGLEELYESRNFFPMSFRVANVLVSNDIAISASKTIEEIPDGWWDLFPSKQAAEDTWKATPKVFKAALDAARPIGKIPPFLLLESLVGAQEDISPFAKKLEQWEEILDYMDSNIPKQELEELFSYLDNIDLLKLTAKQISDIKNALKEEKDADLNELKKQVEKAFRGWVNSLEEWYSRYSDIFDPGVNLYIILTELKVGNVDIPNAKKILKNFETALKEELENPENMYNKAMGLESQVARSQHINNYERESIRNRQNVLADAIQTLNFGLAQLDSTLDDFLEVQEDINNAIDRNEGRLKSARDEQQLKQTVVNKLLADAGIFEQRIQKHHIGADLASSLIMLKNIQGQLAHLRYDSDRLHHAIQKEWGAEFLDAMRDKGVLDIVETLNKIARELMGHYPENYPRIGGMESRDDILAFIKLGERFEAFLGNRALSEDEAQEGLRQIFLDYFDQAVLFAQNMIDRQNFITVKFKYKYEHLFNKLVEKGVAVKDAIPYAFGRVVFGAKKVRDFVSAVSDKATEAFAKIGGPPSIAAAAARSLYLSIRSGEIKNAELALNPEMLILPNFNNSDAVFEAIIRMIQNSTLNGYQLFKEAIFLGAYKTINARAALGLFDNKGNIVDPEIMSDLDTNSKIMVNALSPQERLSIINGPSASRGIFVETVKQSAPHISEADIEATSNALVQCFIKAAKIEELVKAQQFLDSYLPALQIFKSQWWKDKWGHKWQTTKEAFGHIGNFALSYNMAATLASGSEVLRGGNYVPPIAGYYLAPPLIGFLASQIVSLPPVAQRIGLPNLVSGSIKLGGLGFLAWTCHNTLIDWALHTVLEYTTDNLKSEDLWDSQGKDNAEIVKSLQSLVNGGLARQAKNIPLRKELKQATTTMDEIAKSIGMQEEKSVPKIIRAALKALFEGGEEQEGFVKNVVQETLGYDVYNVLYNKSFPETGYEKLARAVLGTPQAIVQENKQKLIDFVRTSQTNIIKSYNSTERFFQEISDATAIEIKKIVIPTFEEAMKIRSNREYWLEEICTYTPSLNINDYEACMSIIKTYLPLDQDWTVDTIQNFREGLKDLLQMMKSALVSPSSSPRYKALKSILKSEKSKDFDEYTKGALSVQEWEKSKDFVDFVESVTRIDLNRVQIPYYLIEKMIPMYMEYKELDQTKSPEVYKDVYKVKLMHDFVNDSDDIAKNLLSRILLSRDTKTILDIHKEAAQAKISDENLNSEIGRIKAAESVINIQKRGMTPSEAHKLTFLGATYLKNFYTQEEINNIIYAIIGEEEVLESGYMPSAYQMAIAGIGIAFTALSPNLSGKVGWIATTLASLYFLPTAYTADIVLDYSSGFSDANVPIAKLIEPELIKQTYLDKKVNLGIVTTDPEIQKAISAIEHGLLNGSKASVREGEGRIRKFLGNTEAVWNPLIAEWGKFIQSLPENKDSLEEMNNAADELLEKMSSVSANYSTIVAQIASLAQDWQKIAPTVLLKDDLNPDKYKLEFTLIMGSVNKKFEEAKKVRLDRETKAVLGAERVRRLENVGLRNASHIYINKFIQSIINLLKPSIDKNIIRPLVAEGIAKAYFSVYKEGTKDSEQAIKKIFLEYTDQQAIFSDTWDVPDLKTTNLDHEILESLTLTTESTGNALLSQWYSAQAVDQNQKILNELESLKSLLNSNQQLEKSIAGFIIEAKDMTPAQIESRYEQILSISHMPHYSDAESNAGFIMANIKTHGLLGRLQEAKDIYISALEKGENRDESYLEFTKIKSSIPQVLNSNIQMLKEMVSEFKAQLPKFVTREYLKQMLDNFQSNNSIILGAVAEELHQKLDGLQQDIEGLGNNAIATRFAVSQLMNITQEISKKLDSVERKLVAMSDSVNALQEGIKALSKYLVDHEWKQEDMESIIKRVVKQSLDEKADVLAPMPQFLVHTILDYMNEHKEQDEKLSAKIDEISATEKVNSETLKKILRIGKYNIKSIALLKKETKQSIGKLATLEDFKIYRGELQEFVKTAIKLAEDLEKKDAEVWMGIKEELGALNNKSLEEIKNIFQSRGSYQAKEVIEELERGWTEMGAQNLVGIDALSELIERAVKEGTAIVQEDISILERDVNTVGSENLEALKEELKEQIAKDYPKVKDLIARQGAKTNKQLMREISAINKTMGAHFAELIESGVQVDAESLKGSFSALEGKIDEFINTAMAQNKLFTKKELQELGRSLDLKLDTELAKFPAEIKKELDPIKQEVIKAIQTLGQKNNNNANKIIETINGLDIVDSVALNGIINELYKDISDLLISAIDEQNKEIRSGFDNGITEQFINDALTALGDKLEDKIRALPEALSIEGDLDKYRMMRWYQRTDNPITYNQYYPDTVNNSAYNIQIYNVIPQVLIHNSLSKIKDVGGFILNDPKLINNLSGLSLHETRTVLTKLANSLQEYSYDGGIFRYVLQHINATNKLGSFHKISYDVQEHKRERAAPTAKIDPNFTGYVKSENLWAKNKPSYKNQEQEEQEKEAFFSNLSSGMIPSLILEVANNGDKLVTLMQEKEKVIFHYKSSVPIGASIANILSYPASASTIFPINENGLSALDPYLPYLPGVIKSSLLLGLDFYVLERRFDVDKKLFPNISGEAPMNVLIEIVNIIYRYNKDYNLGLDSKLQEYLHNVKNQAFNIHNYTYKDVRLNESAVDKILKDGSITMPSVVNLVKSFQKSCKKFIDTRVKHLIRGEKPLESTRYGLLPNKTFYKLLLDQELPRIKDTFSCSGGDLYLLGVNELSESTIKALEAPIITYFCPLLHKYVKLAVITSASDKNIELGVDINQEITKVHITGNEELEFSAHLFTHIIKQSMLQSYYDKFLPKQVVQILNTNLSDYGTSIDLPEGDDIVEYTKNKIREVIK